MRRACAVGGALSILGCRGDGLEPAPGVPPACQALELQLPDGSCMRPGMQPEGCAQGFAHDGEYRCAPILPPERCPPGLMAVPGETVCRPVMPCGSGKWGDIPVDATTQHVDASYAGNTSDGSAERPWTEVSAAYAAVAPGGLIAIAAGSYDESVVLVNKPARIWGVCPDRVELLGPMAIAPGADDSELHGLALHGIGASVTGVTGVILDRLWVHGASAHGMDIHAGSGPVAVRVSGSLFEHNVELSLLLAGAVAHVEASVFRHGRPDLTTQYRGGGVQAQDCSPADGCSTWLRSELALAHSLVEDNHEAGVYLLGTDATIEGTVVRGTLPTVADRRMGRGMLIEISCDAAGSCFPEMASRATLRGSMVEQNHDVAVSVVGSALTIEDTVLRATLPRASDQGYGRGLSVEPACPNAQCDATLPANVEVRRVVVEQTHDLGVFVMGSHALIEDSIVRDTAPRLLDQLYGRGMGFQIACSQPGTCFPELRSTAVIRRSAIERSHDVGILVTGSDATLEAVVLGDTRARADGKFGDGLAVLGELAPASASARLLRVEDSQRAGISNFGAVVSIGATRVRCSAFDLHGEPLQEDFAYDDLGDNRCGCPIADHACVAVSPGLEPPAAVAE